MKRIKLILAMILGLTALSAVCHADGRIIPPKQLPAAIQQFVQQHFPEATIAYAEKEIRKYEVHLNDGTELDFSRKGVWDKVDCKFKPVPAVLIPQPIAAYVEANFPGSSIVKIDKEHYGYEIELNNDLELKFNKAGQLFSMDD